MNAQLEQLKSQLKEKEQLQRISTYKLSEVKRQIKHNQLKPIKKEDKPEPVAKASEGKPIMQASPALHRAITGKEPKPVEKKKTEMALSSVEGSFYNDSQARDNALLNK